MRLYSPVSIECKTTNPRFGDFQSFLLSFGGWYGRKRSWRRRSILWENSGRVLAESILSCSLAKKPENKACCCSSLSINSTGRRIGSTNRVPSIIWTWKWILYGLQMAARSLPLLDSFVLSVLGAKSFGWEFAQTLHARIILDSNELRFIIRIGKTVHGRTYCGRWCIDAQGRQ